MIKIVLLDFGGVLFPSLWPEGQQSKEERDRLKNPVVKILRRNWQDVEAGKFKQQELREALLKSGKYQDSEIFLILRSLTTINFDVLGIVGNLRRHGIKIYSYNNERPLWTDFRRILFSLDKVFCGYFVSCDIGYEKPSLQSAAYVISALKVMSEECLVIDDQKQNIETLGRYGFKVYHFTDVRRLKHEIRRIGIIS